MERPTKEMIDAGERIASDLIDAHVSYSMEYRGNSEFQTRTAKT